MKKILLLACAVLAEAQFAPLQITTASLPPGSVGLRYSTQLSATGGFGYTWSATGLPPGLSCSPAGVISGNPTSSGSYAVSVSVSSSQGEAAGPTQASKQFPLSISGPLAIQPASLPNGFVGKPYSFSFSATGGSGQYSWTGIALPDGLTMSLDGTLSGTPGPNSPGTYSIQVEVTDASFGNTISSQFPLAIAGSLQIATLVLPNSTISASYSQTVQASGGAGPYTFSAVSSATSVLPPGLNLSKPGTLSGNPTTAGTYSFTVTVTDSAGTVASQTYTVTINPLPSIANSSPLPPATLGVPNYTVTFQASGGTAPFTFAVTGAAPPGLSLSLSGILSGTPASTGIFVFGVTVTDGSFVSATKQFQITVTPPSQLLLVTPTQLDFVAAAAGSAPPSQQFAIVSSNGAAVNFAIQVDGGAANTPAPSWLSIHLSKGVTPAVLSVVVDQTGLSAGSFSGRITFSVPNDTSQTPIVAKVTLTLSNVAPQLELSPGFLRFGARVAAPATLEQVIVVQNSGGGTLNYGASVVNRSTWIASVTPAAGQTAPNQPVIVTIAVNTQGLMIGSYRDVIRFTWSGGSIDIPVSLFVADQGPILSLDKTGFYFEMRQGNGSSASRTVRVLDQGDPASTIQWTAQLLSGQAWLALGASQGTATAGTPGTLSLTVSQGASALVAGGHYALLQFSDAHALNSPQYAMAVLDVAPAAAPVQPELSSPPLFFSAPAGSTAKPTGSVRVDASSTNPIAFQAAAETDDGGSWLQASPMSGFASTGNPGQVAVTLDPSSLGAGVHKGQINVSIGGTLRTTDVTLIVVAGGGNSAAALREAVGCTPTRLALTLSGLSNSFSTPAGWPATLSVQLNDDCAKAVINGSVIASFSNGDPPIPLASDMLTGSYSATWQPGRSSSPMTVSLLASAGALANATAQIDGAVTTNVAPVLAPGGTLNNLNPVVGGALAPGTISEVFGSGLATATTSPGVVPLPISYNGTDMLVGGLDAPLFYLSSNQLDVQLPNELVPNRQYAVIVSINGALTLPDTIDVVPVQPGLLASSDGSIIAQHGADYSLVNTAHPAHPGESLILYLVGMGATNPAVASGQPASLNSLTPAVAHPTVTVDGQAASVIFAGLTPGAIGLFQINFTVPPTARTGSLKVVVMQGGVTANTAALPVGP